jgi:hypothetical protein
MGDVGLEPDAGSGPLRTGPGVTRGGGPEQVMTTSLGTPIRHGVGAAVTGSDVYTETVCAVSAPSV